MIRGVSRLDAVTSMSDIQAWRDGVAGVLRKSGKIGADESPERPDDLLVTRTADGLPLKPLYTSADLPERTPDPETYAAPQVQEGRPEGWYVCQRVAGGPDVSAVNETALHELETGATALWVRLGGPGGVPAGSLADALAAVQADLAPVVIEPGEDALAAAQEALDWASADADVQLGLDPLGEAARRGSQARPALAPPPEGVAAVLNRARETGPGVRVLVADGSPVTEAGGTEAQQLAVAVTAAVQYLRDAAGRGIDPAETAARLDLRLAVTDDQFASLCSVRAARLLWQQAAASLGLEGAQPRIHATTARAMLSVHDPWTNMLRVTVAAFAAGAGGADLVTVDPFDARIGRPDRFAQRIARNTQSLLLMESHVGAVSDPGAGSYYVEARTADLAEAAWKLVREIEAAGGLREALAQGLVASWVRTAWGERRTQLAKRRQPLTGVSEFPILDQQPVVREELPDGLAEAVEDENALVPVNYGADFEALRAAAEQSQQSTGVPVVLLGSIATSSARAGFVTNLLAVGGLRAVTVGPVKGGEDVAAAVESAGASLGPVVVIAGRDKEYADIGEVVVSELRRAGAEHVIVAGKQGVVSGTDAAVGVGADVVTTLGDIQSRVLKGAGA